MRWLEPLDEILGSRAKIRVLRCLWRADGEPLSGREVARRVGLSHTGVLRALSELGEQDVVWPSADPSGTRYRLNRTHDLVRDGLMPLFGLEDGLEGRVVSRLADAVPHAVSIVLFGSVARERDAAASDLDVLVVVAEDDDVPDADDAIDAVEFYARFGKLLNPIVMSVREVKDLLAARAPLMENIVHEGRLLWGRPVLTMDGGGARAS